MKKLLFILIIILFISFSGLTQQYFFKRISVEEGLPLSSVCCVIQDSSGHLWIGTNGAGVCRFDGREFKIFNRSNGLSGNIVRSLLEDSKGNIWIGTDRGLTLYDGYNFSIISEEKNLTGSNILVIREDNEGIIWAGSNDAGLFRIENGDSIRCTVTGIPDGLISNFIFDIEIDERGRLWLAMVGGVNIVEFNKDKPQVTRLIKGIDIPSDFVICAEKGHEGELWFGTHGDGVFKIRTAENLRNIKVEKPEFFEKIRNSVIWDIRWTANQELWLATDQQGVIRIKDGKAEDHFSQDNGLQADQIVNIMEDREGNIWFASLLNGLSMFSDKRFILYNTVTDLKNKQIFSLLEEKEDVLYTGTDEGLFSYRKNDDRLIFKKHFSIRNGLPDNNVNALARAADNIIWIGTSNGLSRLKNGVLSEFRADRDFFSRKINCLLVDSRNNLWTGTDNGYNKLTSGKVFSMNEDNGLVNNEIQTIIEDRQGNIWMGTLGGLVRIKDSAYSDYIGEDGLHDLSIHSLAEDRTGNIWIGTFGGGIYKFDIRKDSVPVSLEVAKGVLSSNNIYSLAFRSDSVLVAASDNGFDEIFLDKDLSVRKAVHYGPDDGFVGGKNNLNALFFDTDGTGWFGTSEGLIRYNPGITDKSLTLPGTVITGIQLFFEDVDWAKRGGVTRGFNLPSELVLPYNENHLTFKFTGISLQDPEALRYSYYLEGQSKAWSPYSGNRELTFQGLAPGDYRFLVRSVNKYGLEGQPAVFEFTIKPPFWRTTWFIILSVITLIAALYTGMQLRLRKLQKEKIRLEKIVEERTKEVVSQKNEIERQRDIVIHQKQEITDSINYARKIQSAVLPEHEIMKDFFDDYFILFRPRAIVSGDFYWVNRKDDHIIFIASDCTGHGVPGAFMSMLGVSYLNEIVNEDGIVRPDLILSKLRANVIGAFQRHNIPEDETKDGMDIAACSYNLKTRKLFFAGANNPLYLVRKTNGECHLDEIPADRMPVAYYAKMRDFVCHEIDISKGDSVYLFSDGFMDQFGGPEGKKFMRRKFQDMFLSHQHLTMAEQREVYEKILVEWMEFRRDDEDYIGQIDDVLVIGIKF